MANVAPEPVELGTSDPVVPHEQDFHRLGVFSSFIEPLEDGIFFEASHARRLLTRPPSANSAKASTICPSSFRLPWKIVR